MREHAAHLNQFCYVTDKEIILNKNCVTFERIPSVILSPAAELFLGPLREVVVEPIFSGRVLFPQPLLPELDKELPVGLLREDRHHSR